MKFRPAHILLPLCALLLSACAEKAPIPRKDMAEMYADMFLADQWLDVHTEYRTKTDTMLVYAPIFEKYGYTPEEFSESMAFYLRDPERYARMLMLSSKKLHLRRDELKKFVDHRDWVAQTFKDVDRNFTATQPRFFTAPLKADSTGVFMPDTLLWDRLYRSRYDTLTVYYPMRDTATAEKEADTATAEKEAKPSTSKPQSKSRSRGVERPQIMEKDVSWQ